MTVTLTHAEWCRWLKALGLLATDHRRCITASWCQAPRTGVEWRYQYQDQT